MRIAFSAGPACLSIVGIVAAVPVFADMPPITRASLAASASFTVTQTLAPQGGAKYVRVYRIEIKGNRARVDFSDPSAGDLRYLANDKGLFVYLPSSKTATKEAMRGGIDGALQQAFQQARVGMAGAARIGSAVVSGQPTDIYRSARNGALVYFGKKPGFRLPVKTEQKNEGGSQSLLVTNIRLNIPLADKDFALPAGTQIIDSASDSPTGRTPGGRG